MAKGNLGYFSCVLSVFREIPAISTNRILMTEADSEDEAESKAVLSDATRASLTRMSCELCVELKLKLKLNLLLRRDEKHEPQAQSTTNHALY